MSKKEYGSNKLNQQIIIKIVILLVIFAIAYLNKKNSISFLELSENKNITIQITILLILSGYIIYTLVIGKNNEISSKYYYSLLLFYYLNFISYIFILFTNNFYNYNNIIVIKKINLSKFLIILTLLFSLIFSILELTNNSKNKSILVDLVVEDNIPKFKKFNIFLDTCINFIYVFVILNIAINIIIS